MDHCCELGKYNFKVFNGLLQKFKQQHNIKQLVVSREDGTYAMKPFKYGWRVFQP